jgi:PPM family protein phosphatase
MDIGKATHLGNVRKINEDSFLVKESKGSFLLVVADGMGGHNAGEIASAMAVKNIEEYILNENFKVDEERLSKALKFTNKTVFESADKQIRHRGMGTTVTAVFIKDSKACFANVGDSRAYWMGDGELKQITKDHSYVQMLVDQKVLTNEEARFHPRRNLITRAIGTTEKIEVDTFCCEFNEDDIILLCSDGLTSHVDDDFIKATLSENNSVDMQIKKLIDEALKQGGSDNITVLIAKQTPKAGDVQ